jgi:hypothetical protein
MTSETGAKCTARQVRVEYLKLQVSSRQVLPDPSQTFTAQVWCFEAATEICK